MNALASVCTDQFLHSDRLMKWREFMSTHLGKTPDYIRRLENTHFEPINERPFTGRLEYGALGSLNFCRMTCSPHRFSRSLSKALAPSDTPWLLILQMSEVSHFEQGSKNSTLTPGEILLLDCGRPFSVTSVKGCEYLMLLCHGLDESVHETNELHLNNRNGLGRMLHHLITDAYAQYALLNDATSSLVGQSIISLLDNTLNNQRQEARLEHDFRYFKKHRIKSFIEHNLAERDLTIERIARFVQCSVRTLHRVFEDETASSLSDYILQRRLSRCAEDLRSPDNLARSITDIAYGWGFNSSSHFSKTFKTAYGVSPKLFRESRIRGSASGGL
ncbi:helix-turn-helix domain-containing protein [Pseudomonas sp. NPDC089734]|uniref:helix-turn-helix domain-containing protein n=1 Tax=Pseudomonas sp. NPDC089734 TaxID=3364469 RepID=UPI003804D0FD